MPSYPEATKHGTKAGQPAFFIGIIMILRLICFLCLLLPVMANAAPDQKAAQVEAESYAKTCAANPVQASRYHCSCLAATIYDARMRRDNRDVAVILAEKGRNCVDTARIAGQMFRQCQQFPRRDKSTQLDYCSCYAREMARLTKRYDDDLPIAVQRQMTLAMQHCQSRHPDRGR